MEETGWRRPESVLVLVAEPGGRVLLLERREPAGFWQSVTGGVRHGESPRAAARRELFEETGFDGGVPLIDLRRSRRFPVVPPWSARYAPGTRTNLEHAFLALLPAPRRPRLARAEHVRACWLHAREARRRAFSWTDRETIAWWAALSSGAAGAAWANWARWPLRRPGRGG